MRGVVWEVPGGRVRISVVGPRWEKVYKSLNILNKKDKVRVKMKLPLFLFKSTPM